MDFLDDVILYMRKVTVGEKVKDAGEYSEDKQG